MGLHLENEVGRRLASDHNRSHAGSIAAEMGRGLSRPISTDTSENFKPAFTAAMDWAWDR